MFIKIIAYSKNTYNLFHKKTKGEITKIPRINTNYKTLICLLSKKNVYIMIRTFIEKAF